MAAGRMLQQKPHTQQMNNIRRNQAHQGQPPPSVLVVVVVVVVAAALTMAMASTRITSCWSRHMEKRLAKHQGRTTMML